MTWPTGNNGEDAFKAIHLEIKRLKNLATDLRAKSLAGTLRRDEAANFSTQLADSRDLITLMLGVSGLDAYAKSILGAGFDTIAEGNARITAINNMQSWICGPTTANPGASAGNYPLSTDSFLKEKTFDSNGRWSIGTFTAAATAGFRTQIDTFLAGLS